MGVFAEERVMGWQAGHAGMRHSPGAAGWNFYDGEKKNTVAQTAVLPTANPPITPPTIAPTGAPLLLAAPAGDCCGVAEGCGSSTRCGAVHSGEVVFCIV